MNNAVAVALQTPCASFSMLEAIFESAPVAMILSARDGSIRMVNREVETLFGYPRGELIGQSIDILVPQPLRHAHANLRDHFVERPAARKMGTGRELFGLRSDHTTVPIEIALAPVNDGPDLLTLSVIVDIAQRRRLEADIRSAHQELEQRIRDHAAEMEIANREEEALVADLSIQRARLERLGREDPLTRLSNPRDFDRRLGLEIERAKQQGLPLAVAMLDLDHFKEINDRYGHALGDTMLRSAAGLIRHECRSIDVVARYGGEEFALAFPGTNIAAAIHLCERVRLAFVEFDWNGGRSGIRLTVSAGVSPWRRGLNPETLLAQADANLHEAKRRGRNCVVPAQR